MGKPTARKQAVKKKGKKQVKNKKPSKRWELYNKGYKRFCPKCGPGIFLGDHKDRFYCGKCYYVEYKKPLSLSSKESLGKETSLQGK